MDAFVVFILALANKRIESITDQVIVSATSVENMST